MLPLIYIGSISIPSYGICMATGIVVACVMAYIRLKHRGGSFDSLLLVVAVALAIGLCCAKISYYLFSYGIDRLFSEIASGDFTGFSDSGLVYYGGLIGGIIGAYIAIRVAKYDFNVYVNAIVPCIPLGHAFGRIGCLLAGCCYGLHYDGVCAIHSVYVDPTETLFPIQAVESLVNIALFIILLIYTQKERKGIITLSLYLVLYSIVRFVLEFFRGDLIRGIYLGVSTSQWISALLVIISVFVIVLDRQNKLQSFKNMSNLEEERTCLKNETH